jgi:hypothetical protein
LLSLQSLRQISTYEDFDVLTADHKIIAVVPFEATVELRPKQREKISNEECCARTKRGALQLKCNVFMVP